MKFFFLTLEIQQQERMASITKKANVEEGVFDRNLRVGRRVFL